MKFLFTILLTIITCRCCAQTLSGQLLDEQTHLPIANAYVHLAGGGAFTNSAGEFTLKPGNPGDTISINQLGYQPFKVAAANWGSARRIIMLKVNTIKLSEVSVTARKDPVKDSINLRRDFAREFGYRAPGIKNILRPTSSNVPFAFVTVDVLSLFGALTKNSSAQSRLKKQLLADEQSRHVNRRYNDAMVKRITGLRGDSLATFMSSFRPSGATIDRLSDYDLILYIKENLQKYRLGQADTVASIFKK